MGSVPELYLDAWARLQCQNPMRVSDAEWRQAIDDAGRFLDQWGSLADEFQWWPSAATPPPLASSNFAPLPRWVVEALANLIQNKVAEAHLVQTELGYFLALPAKPPRKLSGCCAYHVRSKDGKS